MRWPPKIPSGGCLVGNYVFQSNQMVIVFHELSVCFSGLNDKCMQVSCDGLNPYCFGGWYGLAGKAINQLIQSSSVSRFEFRTQLNY